MLPEGFHAVHREPRSILGCSVVLLLAAFPRFFPSGLGTEGALSWVGGVQPGVTPPWLRAWTSPDSAIIPVQWKIRTKTPVPEPLCPRRAHKMIYVGLGRTFQSTAPSGPLTPSYESEIHFKIRDIPQSLLLWMGHCSTAFSSFSRLLGFFFFMAKRRGGEDFSAPLGSAHKCIYGVDLLTQLETAGVILERFKRKGRCWKGCGSLCLGLNS